MISVHEHELSSDAPHALSTLGIVLVAAGRGERLGAGKPKAFVELQGSTLIEHCVSTITALPHGGHLVIVVPEALAAETLSLVSATVEPGSLWEISVTPGGRERHESVRFGIDALHDTANVVLVHDAARPLAPRTLFERVAAEVARTGDSVIPALPVADTLKRVGEGGIVHETVDRSPLVAVQTPQGFLREQLAAAHDRLGSAAPDSSENGPTDDAEVVQRAGGTVRVVAGDMLAHKLTVPGDLMLLEALLTTETGNSQ
ncbi:2-C-methyl-D-erythritol 4-phosphate cytidylyltransferase [Leucobacter komagatae]|uniref:2-C-methyl-D-erythritol 4-phosphate cytidylyltransferase n=1 Tax=Leucobacter komagatae TaxID=55969 RepID=UPI0005ABFF01|nr:2-C-methyl-D-erythritol 4-phosphate cytidylyltransferase [Leucobacter komagatae]